MSRVLRKAFSFVAAGAFLIVLERVSRRSGAMRRLLAKVRPTPVTDASVEGRVRAQLQRAATRPELIQVSVEHGCVELRGPIETRERAQLVQELSRLRGVDAIVDLLTEPEPETSATAAPGTGEDRGPAALPPTHVP